MVLPDLETIKPIRKGREYPVGKPVPKIDGIFNATAATRHAFDMELPRDASW